MHEVLLKSLFVSITWKDPSPVDMSDMLQQPFLIFQVICQMKGPAMSEEDEHE